MASKSTPERYAARWERRLRVKVEWVLGGISLVRLVMTAIATGLLLLRTAQVRLVIGQVRFVIAQVQVVIAQLQLVIGQVQVVIAQVQALIPHCLRPLNT
jgi:hypothetical protein